MRGNVVKFGEKRCWITGKNGSLYGMETVSDKLYYLDCHITVQDHAAVVSQSHRRLNKRGRELSFQSMIS